MTDTRKVVLNRPLLDRSQQLRLERAANVSIATGDDLLEALGDADGAIIIRPTPVTATMLDGAPKLKVLATVSSGVDHVDVAAVAARGIRLVAGGGVAPGPVAEWVLWAILSQRRSLFDMARRTSESGFDDWSARLESYVSRESRG